MVPYEPPMDPRDAAAEAASDMAFALAGMMKALLDNGRATPAEVQQLLMSARRRFVRTRSEATLRAMLDGAWTGLFPNGPAPPA